MSIKFRLTAMQFLQFFVWGAWLIPLGGYMGGTLHFEGGQIGAIFATMGIASLIMPGLTCIIADKCTMRLGEKQVLYGFFFNERD